MASCLRIKIVGLIAFSVGLTISTLANAQNLQVSVEKPAVIDSAIRKSNSKTVSLSAVVNDRKKYSFTIDVKGEPVQVKLASGAPVALKMVKPWYDWDNDRVVVDALHPDDSSSAEPARIPYTLPAKQLYVISRFQDANHMRRIMSKDPQWLSFYLVTPNDPGAHFPTSEQPYIAGKLRTIGTDKPASLIVKGMGSTVVLGLQDATMNGFSIANLEPFKTKVTLTGTLGEDNAITADRIVFNPIQPREEK
jgi:hypothetical protein